MLILNHRILKCIALNLLAFFLILPAHAATAIPFNITMSEAVNVTGSPRIAVDVGGVTRYATYASGTGTSSLTFTYAAQAGDVDLDGVTLSSPIDLNGGTITDLNGNPKTDLTFTVPDTSGIKIDYPSLSMDFIADADGRYTLNGTAYNDLPAFLSATGGTFARNSVGTYFDSAGVLQTASANQPRFDHDPVTQAPKGILIEESRTNLIINSESMNSWATEFSGLSVTADAVTAPDNTMTADLAFDNSYNGRHIRIGNSITITAGQIYTVSIYAKADTDNTFQLLFAVPAFSSNAYANFLLNGAGSITYSAPDIINAKIVSLNNGWYRCSITSTAIANGLNTSMFIALLDGNSGNTTRSPTYIGTGKGLYFWGAQQELGSFATSYIKTNLSAVTRQSDIITIPTGSWYNNSVTSMYGDYVSFASANYSTRLASFNNATSSNVIQLANSASGFVVNQKAVLGVISTQSGPAYVPNQNYKVAMANDATSMPFVVNNTLYNNAYTGVPVITRLQIGNQSSGTILNGTVKNFKYYPARISNTQLQMMTQ